MAWLVDEAGAKVDALDDEGETPLSVAAAGGEVPALTALLARGADPALAGPGGAPPLCRAAASGCAAAVEALVAAGADANAESAAGPPLLWAAGGGGSAAVKALLNAGAKADAVAEGGVTALLLAAATGKKVQRRLFAFYLPTIISAKTTRPPPLYPRPTQKTRPRCASCSTPAPTRPRPPRAA